MLRIRVGRQTLRDRDAKLSPLCRPSGWIALWRRIGTLSVLNARLELSL
jgi:hypothetical protein